MAARRREGDDLRGRDRRGKEGSECLRGESAVSEGDEDEVQDKMKCGDIREIMQLGVVCSITAEEWF